jgi:hypothetical protein
MHSKGLDLNRQAETPSNFKPHPQSQTPLIASTSPLPPLFIRFITTKHPERERERLEVNTINDVVVFIFIVSPMFH